MTSARCFIFHSWSKWEDLSNELSVINPDRSVDPPVCTGYYMVQQRRCGNCGKLQLRRTRT